MHNPYDSSGLGSLLLLLNLPKPCPNKRARAPVWAVPLPFNFTLRCIHSVIYIPQWYAPFRLGLRWAKEHTATALALLSYKLPQIFFSLTAGYYFPCFQDQLQDKEAEPYPRESSFLEESGEEDAAGEPCVCSSLAQLIRKMTATTLAVRPARLHYCNLQDLKHKALKRLLQCR